MRSIVMGTGGLDLNARHLNEDSEKMVHVIAVGCKRHRGLR